MHGRTTPSGTSQPASESTSTERNVADLVDLGAAALIHIPAGLLRLVEELAQVLDVVFTEMVL